MDERPQRSCDLCGLIDDHPRHVLVLEPGVAQVAHLDCCAANGCPVCQASEEANGGRRGDELIAYLAAEREVRDG